LVSGEAHCRTGAATTARRGPPSSLNPHPQQRAQQLATDLEDYAHDHTNQARELSEVVPLILRARDTLRDVAAHRPTAPLTQQQEPLATLTGGQGPFHALAPFG
jgi:hypothetical protein